MKGLYKPAPLHIPDGFLSVSISVIFWVLSIIFILIAVRRSRSTFTERQVPLMGVMAAFIFAAQMINFPVAGGTSGHLLGGALAAITLGPWAGMLVMTAVVGVQALVFQDGGVLVMGANIFNMGILTVLISFGLYTISEGRGQKTTIFFAGSAAWLSVMASALLTSFQLWLSGVSALRLVFPAMLGVHALIGIGEVLITVAALGFIRRTRPDLLEAGNIRRKSVWVLIGILIALIVVFLAPFASGAPDGLESVAIDLGFIDQGADPGYEILPDYTIPLLGESVISTIAAGIIGVLLVALVIFGITRLVRNPSKT